MTVAVAVVLFATLAGGASVMRALSAQQFNRDGRPFGTVLVNLSGSLLAGLSVGLQAPWATLLVAAGAGALTTFSTFAAESVALVRAGARTAACIYVGGTILTCTAMAWLGLNLAQG